MQKECPAEPKEVSQFNPLAAKAATISLSSFGGGLFGFDFFSNKLKKSKQNKRSSKQEPSSQVMFFARALTLWTSKMALDLKSRNVDILDIPFGYMIFQSFSR